MGFWPCVVFYVCCAMLGAIIYGLIPSRGCSDLDSYIHLRSGVKAGHAATQRQHFDEREKCSRHAEPRVARLKPGVEITESFCVESEEEIYQTNPRACGPSTGKD